MGSQEAEKLVASLQDSSLEEEQFTAAIQARAAAVFGPDVPLHLGGLAYLRGKLPGRGAYVLTEDLSGQVLQDDELARLLTFPNVLITSHQAFLTREALGDIANTTVTNLEALANGKPFVEGSVLT